MAQLRFFSYCILVLFLFTKNPASAQETNLPAALFQKWVHSHEEDKPGIKVYRGSAYDFPPSRGREGFRLKKNGTVIWSAIAATDGNKNVKGTWNRKGNNLLEIRLAGGEKFQMEILSAEKDILKIKNQF
jgi:hypothetical protein